MPAPVIYTVGTSNRTKEEFLDILNHYSIEAVVDVRRFPKSKFDHFAKENLTGILEEDGFHYRYLGKELGGFRKEGYETYTRSAAYQQSIEHLERAAQKNFAAITCAERLPWRCHRRFIATSLSHRGWQVVHIIDKDRV